MQPSHNTVSFQGARSIHATFTQPRVKAHALPHTRAHTHHASLTVGVAAALLTLKLAAALTRPIWPRDAIAMALLIPRLQLAAAIRNPTSAVNRALRVEACAYVRRAGRVAPRRGSRVKGAGGPRGRLKRRGGAGLRSSRVGRRLPRKRRAVSQAIRALTGADGRRGCGGPVERRGGGSWRDWAKANGKREAGEDGGGAVVLSGRSASPGAVSGASGHSTRAGWRDGEGLAMGMRRCGGVDMVWRHIRISSNGRGGVPPRRPPPAPAAAPFLVVPLSSVPLPLCQVWLLQPKFQCIAIPAPVWLGAWTLG
eukprot:351059-Chlamydomonas_euryale.AAC.1